MFELCLLTQALFFRRVLQHVGIAPHHSWFWEVSATWQINKPPVEARKVASFSEKWWIAKGGRMIPDDPYVCPVVSGSRIVTMAFMNRSRDLKKPRCNPIMEGVKKTQGRNWFCWVWTKIPGLILYPCMETQSSSGNITKHTTKNPSIFSNLSHSRCIVACATLADSILRGPPGNFVWT